MDINYNYVTQSLIDGKTFKDLAIELNIPESTLKTKCNKKGIFSKKIKKSENNTSHKKCSCCGISKEFSEFYKNKDKFSSYCKVCQREKMTNRNKETKEYCIEYKGGKCEKCGYNKCIAALEFHHLDPNEKDFEISDRKGSLENLKKELDKCILVCSNCHRELHNL